MIAAVLDFRRRQFQKTTCSTTNATTVKQVVAFSYIRYDNIWNSIRLWPRLHRNESLADSAIPLIWAVSSTYVKIYAIRLRRVVFLRRSLFIFLLKGGEFHHLTQFHDLETASMANREIITDALFTFIFISNINTHAILACCLIHPLNLPGRHEMEDVLHDFCAPVCHRRR